MATNLVSSEPLLVYPEMGDVRRTPDGLVSWGGVAMPAARAYPKVPFMVWDAPGPGVWPVQGPAARGQMDVWLIAGAPGLASTCCALVDAGGTRSIKIGLDAINRPTASVLDVTGGSAASFAGSGAAISSGTRMHLRLTWDCQQVVSVTTGLYVALALNGEAATGTWTGGSAIWTPFPVASVNVGGRPPVATPFNGTLEQAQLGLLRI